MGEMLSHTKLPQADKQVYYGVTIRDGARQLRFSLRVTKWWPDKGKRNEAQIPQA